MSLVLGEELDSAQTILGLHAVIKGEESHYRFDSQKGLAPVSKPKKQTTVKVMKKEIEQVLYAAELIERGLA